MERQTSQSLFRREALAERQNSFGKAIAWVASYERVLAWVWCVWLVFGSVALALVEYSKKVTVYGTAEQQRRPVSVFSPRPGVVKQVSTFEGEWVRAGAVLTEVGMAETLSALLMGLATHLGDMPAICRVASYKD